ncbi:pentapeptide repeat-containing protein [Mycolicibacterium sp. HK-90]|uniref:pentapeptide repeat-containing protein n=1 Tax=Mycolicibacterium sp. HK-90 TaxID=3056937 RepID=UPI00265B5E23|nr:pentapeptide repeat-containing protein [Mycolicibacterium sp. HK-90]WKG04932.1 pentapeptide repeat-containing protein [Mycolicibacterium sp. HK-90]
MSYQGESQRSIRTLTRRAEVLITSCAVAITATALVVLPWWLTTDITSFGSNNPADGARLRLDIIRTVFALAAGIGGGVALWLAIRRQRSTELDLIQKETSYANADYDAAQRRITEQYVQASNQLGSDRIAVRLAGVYAFERLAQDNPTLRQVVVDLMCTYLRTSATNKAKATYKTSNPSGYPRLRTRSKTGHPAAQVGGSETRMSTEPEQSEVTNAIRDVVTKHLRWYTVSHFDRPSITAGTDYWSDISINLSAVMLDSWDLSGCRINNANFNDAIFTGETRLSHLNCTGNISFDRAAFQCDASFYRCVFENDMSMISARFEHEFKFEHVSCRGYADFSDTELCWTSWFDDTNFKTAFFERTRFGWDSWFNRTHFEDTVDFSTATFDQGVRFGGAIFDGHYSSGDPGHLRAASQNNPNARIEFP